MVDTVDYDRQEKKHLRMKLGILRDNRNKGQHRGILKTIHFLETYVERKFPISDNVTVKTDGCWQRLQWQRRHGDNVTEI